MGETGHGIWARIGMRVGTCVSKTSKDVNNIPTALFPICGDPISPICPKNISLDRHHVREVALASPCCPLCHNPHFLSHFVTTPILSHLSHRSIPILSHPMLPHCVTIPVLPHLATFPICSPFATRHDLMDEALFFFLMRHTPLWPPIPSPRLRLTPPLPPRNPSPNLPNPSPTPPVTPLLPPP